MASIRKRGSKWQVQVRRLGSPAVSRSFDTRKDALEWARHQEVRADRGELTGSAKALSRITLGELVERYRDEIVPTKKGHEVEGYILNAFLRDPLAKRKLSELRLSDWTAYRDRRLRTISGKSLARELSPLRNMFTIARDEWEVPLRDNPLGRLKLGNVDRKRERRLRSGELEAIQSAARKTRNPLLLPIIVFALETAMRRGEIVAIRWEHVDLERRSVLVAEAKNGHPRRVPLSRMAMAILEELPRMGERVFPTTTNAIRLAWEKLTTRAGIDDLHFHDLRHEAISRLFEKGLTVPEVASISGHRDIRMLMRYAHAQSSAVLNKLDGGSDRHGIQGA